MKKVFGWVLGLLSLGVVFGQLDPMNMPKLDAYVNDFSQVLSVEQQQELNTLAQQYDSASTRQIVSFLFPNRNGNELIDIGVKVFNENGIGQKATNNGLLLVIATEEKKIRIIVGYGLEGAMPDLLASKIIEEDIRPLVNAGDIYGAVKKFYERSIQAIDSGEGDDYKDTMSDQLSFDEDEDGVGWFLGLALGFIFVSLIKHKSSKKGSKKKGFAILGAIAVILLVVLGLTVVIGLISGIVFGFTGFMPGRGGSGGFGGGSFGGGGGGFSGGGGSSGGGGAGD